MRAVYRAARWARWTAVAGAVALCAAAPAQQRAQAAPPEASGPGSAAPAVHHNLLGMAFVRVPAGRFLMGSDEPAAALALAFPQLEARRFEALADEAPVHGVHITRPFWLGQHEVTVGQFRRFLQASGHVPESVADGTGGYGYDPAHDPAQSVRGDAFAGRDRRWSWADPGFPQGDEHPVVNVSWHDAVAMAQWLSRREGRVYRLPTEAEWEYACRAGSRGRYGHGDDPQALASHGNVFDLDAAADWPRWAAMALPAHDGWRFTAPVGRFAPNAFGLHDLHGNVWEWVADRYGEDYYARSPAADPTGPAEGHLRVRRGGSWHSWPFYTRCSYRNWNTPTTRYTLVGFRLLLEETVARRAADAAPLKTPQPPAR